MKYRAACQFFLCFIDIHCYRLCSFLKNIFYQFAIHCRMKWEGQIATSFYIYHLKLDFFLATESTSERYFFSACTASSSAQWLQIGDFQFAKVIHSRREDKRNWKSSSDGGGSSRCPLCKGEKKKERILDKPVLWAFFETKNKMSKRALLYIYFLFLSPMREISLTRWKAFFWSTTSCFPYSLFLYTYI